MLSLGKEKVNAVAGARCCGKPRGCRMTHGGCLFLRHPWKRAMLFDDRTVRCQAMGVDPATGCATQCDQMHGHEPPCSPTIVGQVGDPGYMTCPQGDAA